MGIGAATLPVILVVFGTVIFKDNVMPSISHYYYNTAQHWYLITWATLGFCLLAYRGYGTDEQVTGTIGGVAAIAAAVLPPRKLVPCEQEGFLVWNVEEAAELWEGFRPAFTFPLHWCSS